LNQQDDPQHHQHLILIIDSTRQEFASRIKRHVPDAPPFPTQILYYSGSEDPHDGRSNSQSHEAIQGGKEKYGKKAHGEKQRRNRRTDLWEIRYRRSPSLTFSSASRVRAVTVSRSSSGVHGRQLPASRNPSVSGIVISTGPRRRAPDPTVARARDRIRAQ
jgi:hypothetical protein